MLIMKKNIFVQKMKFYVYVLLCACALLDATFYLYVDVDVIDRQIAKSEKMTFRDEKQSMNRIFVIGKNKRDEIIV